MAAAFQTTAIQLCRLICLEPRELFLQAALYNLVVLQTEAEVVEPRARMATAVTEELRQFEMQLPGDRRKEFVISIDTAHVRNADPNSARNFQLVVAIFGGGVRGEPRGR